MATVDELLAAFRQALLADGTLVGLVPGGWLMDRQTSAQSSPYGLIMMKFQSQKQTSGALFWNYRFTTVVYPVVGATVQKDIPTRLAFLLDNKTANVTGFMPAGAGLIMISPTDLDQHLARQMKAGADVTPLMSQWVVQTAQSRA